MKVPTTHEITTVAKQIRDGGLTAEQCSRKFYQLSVAAREVDWSELENAYQDRYPVRYLRDLVCREVGVFTALEWISSKLNRRH